MRTLGDTPVADIDRAAVLRAIEDVWRCRPATARKVLRFAIRTALRSPEVRNARWSEPSFDGGAA